MAATTVVAAEVVVAVVVMAVVALVVDPRAWITHPPFDPYPMDRGMDRVGLGV